MNALLLMAAGALIHLSSPQESEQGCVVCHGAEHKLMQGGVHAQVGVSCVDCHGGVATAMDEALAHGENLKALTQPRAAVESCAGCHSDPEAMRFFGIRTDQAALYNVSPHGLLLARDETAQVATCVTCHSAHEVRKPSDPRSPINKLRQVETCGGCHSDPDRMAPYGLAVDVVEQFTHSVHGRLLLEEENLSSPACTDCHGSHGATPPRVQDLGRVCGDCHSVVRDYFEESPHGPVALAGGMEECISCHGSHDVAPPSVEMFTGVDERGCFSCHAREGDPGATMARTLAAVLEDFDANIRDTERQLVDAADRGLFIESEHGYLEEARSLRVRAQSLTHALSQGALADLQNRGNAMIEETRESLGVKERTLRDRKIFTSIFMGIVLLLVLVLLGHRRSIGEAGFRRWRHGS